MLDSCDMKLVKRAQGGDTEAIGELYDRHHERIFRYVGSRVQDSRLAEDVTGEVFTRMVKTLPGYRLMQVPFQAWLYRIARNLVVDHFRRENSYATVPIYHAENVGAAHSNPALLVEQRLTAAQIRQALAAIDATQREVIILRFWVGQSLQEVALTLDKSVAAIKSIQHRGLAALAVVMRQI